MAPPPVTTAILPPPGPGLIRPTEADPNPASNPQIFNDAMVVRTVVFVGEQHCSIEHEMDDDDAKSWHFVFYSNDATNDKQQVPIGVLRLVPPPHEPHHDVTSAAFTEPARPYVKLGRLALTKEFRGLGLGKVMINAALEWLGSHAKEITASLQRSKGDETLSGRYTSGRGGDRWEGDVLLHAQKRMEGMYGRCGFKTDESMGTWIEENMVHVGMWRSVDVRGTE